MQQLAVAVEPRFLEEVDAAAEDHLFGRDVQIHAGRVVLVAAFPEERRGVRLVRPLVAGEADVAVESIDAAPHAREEDEVGHRVAQALGQFAAPGEHGGDDLLVPDAAVLLEPVAVVVRGQLAQEREPALGETFEGHQREQLRSWLK